MKCKITCPSHSDTEREFEITPEGRVWPCCYYANAWEKRFSLVNKDGGDQEAQTFLDDEIYQVMKEDPTFNHLDHYELNDIMQHKIFWERIYTPGWESDNPPHICKLNCGERYDEILGSVPGSMLETRRLINGGEDG